MRYARHFILYQISFNVFFSYQGSGKCADIIAYAYQNAREEEVIATDQEGKEKKM